MGIVGEDFQIEFRKLIGDDQVTFRWENIARTYFIKSTYENKYIKIREIGVFFVLRIYVLAKSKILHL
ncbi:hypothetical protein [Paenibacillus lautus]|uniref:hypothetical protein n=1 Tax=Paenibacillus lautus TaxID=1401 RepID=UPI000FDB1DFC|nr:hypothetical protein [Paenibacillus lautus]